MGTDHPSGGGGEPDGEREPEGEREPTDAVREYVLEEHAGVVATVQDCAQAVAAGWNGTGTTDRDRVVPPLRTALERAGVSERLPTVLEGCVSAAGYELLAQPVSAPPYVVVTSRGPVLRATLAGGRLVVTLLAFEVVRDPRPRYVRGPTEPETAVEVRFDGSGT